MEKLDEPKQIPLTFKKTYPIEVALYSHLNKQRMISRGQYIKNTLIAQMFRESPSMMARYPEVAAALKDLLLITNPPVVPQDAEQPKEVPEVAIDLKDLLIIVEPPEVPQDADQPKATLVTIQEPSKIRTSKEKRNSMSSLLG